MKKKLYLKPETLMSDIVIRHSILDPSEGIATGGLAKDRDELDDELQEEASKQVTNQYSLW